MPAKFLGLTSYGKGEGANDAIRADSPRNHGNRNGYAERDADATVHKLLAQGKTVVRDPNGHEVTLPPLASLKPGWTPLTESELDAPRDTGDGETTTWRAELHRNLERAARDANAKPRKTGRTLILDGEFVTEMDATATPVTAPTGMKR